MNYEQRLSDNAIFSFSYAEGERESELDAHGCVFFDLNIDNGARFQVIERDDKKGFNVFMRGIKITPASYITAAELPIWLEWLVKKFGKRVNTCAASIHNLQRSKERKHDRPRIT